MTPSGALTFLLFCSAACGVASSFYAAFLPVHMSQWQVPQSEVGAFFGLHAACALLVWPLCAHLAEKHSVKLLAFSLSLIGASTIALGSFGRIVSLYIGRAAQGVGFAGAATSLIRLAHLSLLGPRGASVRCLFLVPSARSLLETAFLLGFLLGPAFGGVLYSWFGSYSLPYISFGTVVLLFLAGLPVIWVFVSTASAEEGRQQQQQQHQRKQELSGLDAAAATVEMEAQQHRQQQEEPPRCDFFDHQQTVLLYNGNGGGNGGGSERKPVSGMVTARPIPRYGATEESGAPLLRVQPMLVRRSTAPQLKIDTRGRRTAASSPGPAVSSSFPRVFSPRNALLSSRPQRPAKLPAVPGAVQLQLSLNMPSDSATTTDTEEKWYTPMSYPSTAGEEGEEEMLAGDSSEVSELGTDEEDRAAFPTGSSGRVLSSLSPFEKARAEAAAISAAGDDVEVLAAPDLEAALEEALEREFREQQERDRRRLASPAVALREKRGNSTERMTTPPSRPLCTVRALLGALTLLVSHAVLAGFEPLLVLHAFSRLLLPVHFAGLLSGLLALAYVVAAPAAVVLGESIGTTRTLAAGALLMSVSLLFLGPAPPLLPYFAASAGAANDAAVPPNLDVSAPVPPSPAGTATNAQLSALLLSTLAVGIAFALCSVPALLHMHVPTGAAAAVINSKRAQSGAGLLRREEGEAEEEGEESEKDSVEGLRRFQTALVMLGRTLGPIIFCLIKERYSFSWACTFFSIFFLVLALALLLCSGKDRKPEVSPPTLSLSELP